MGGGPVEAGRADDVSIGAGRRLRAALCIDSLAIGGTELNTVRTAERLPEFGVDPLLVVLRPEGPLLDRCHRADVPMVEFRIPPIRSPRGIARGISLIRLLRSRSIDIVHTQDRYTNAFVVPWARLGGFKVLASRRWWDVQPSRALWFGNWLAYRWANGVVANSTRVAELVQRVDGVHPSKITVVPNFIDAAATRELAESDRRAMRRRLGVSEDALVVGCVANLRAVKDHATLITAMARLIPDRPSVMLCLVGDGELRTPLEQQARRLGIAEKVVFAGERPAEVNWHSAFDVSTLTSVSEGFPNTLVEAMIAARPVVATDAGGTADAVRDGETGFLAPVGAVEDVAEALARLLDDAALRAAMGSAAREEALRLYQAAVVLPQLEALYRACARG